MNIQQYYIRTAKTFRLLAWLSLAAALIITAAFSIIGWQYLLHPNALYLVVLAGSFPGFLIAAHAKKTRAKEIKVTTPEQSLTFEKQRRFILVPFVHWLREFVIFTMKGEAVAVIREDVTGLQKAAKFCLHLIGLRPYLKKKIIVENQEGTLYRLYKDRGFKQRYHLYTSDGTKLAEYDMNLLNLLRAYSNIYDEAGNKIGENHGGFGGIQFEVRDINKNKLIDTKYDGIPLEAMNIFAGVRGDIITVEEDLAHQTPIFLLSPLLIQLHYRR
ncbi:hypothetical protein [Alkalicoccus daliensis]|nr:hypothetical protein [Alkalicoccus daliensis]